MKDKLKWYVVDKEEITKLKKLKLMHLSYIMRKPIDLIQKFRKDVVILKCWKKNVENIKEITKK